jgi:lipid-binding SYLF domain-containing protein
MFSPTTSLRMLHLSSLTLIGCSLLLLIVGMTGCASIPGKTGEEQVQTIDELVARTLSDIYKQTPKTREEIATSVGYAILDDKITKIPYVGAGGGYGVAINTKTGAKTYIRMERFDIGFGDGVRSVRLVVIFQSEKKFRDFVSGLWHLEIGTEAAAKAGKAGAAGGAGSGNVGDKGYVVYTITDAGVSATATAGVIHIEPIKLKK